MKTILARELRRHRGLEPDRLEGVLQYLQLGIGTGDGDVRNRPLIERVTVQVREPDRGQVGHPQPDSESDVFGDPERSG